MLSWIIEFSLRNRFLVIVGALAFVVVGAFAVQRIDIDAFPDTTPVQVQVNTVAPALGTDEVEKQITAPIEQVLSGLPRLQQVRSVSKFGLSQVVVTFEDGTDIYFARQVVNERLGSVKLPPNVNRPEMGPVATGLGEVFHYIVTSQGKDLTELRTIHDWEIKPKLRAVRGTAEVNSWGGHEKQYQVRIHPNKLIEYKLTFDKVVEAVEKSMRNVGGGNIRRGVQMLIVQGVGRPETVEQIKGIVIEVEDGKAIKLENVADVMIGSEIRRGAVTADGKGEVVLGLGFMLMGENSHTVTWAMKEKLDEIQANLKSDEKTEHIKITPVYDRTELVSLVIDTVRKNLFEAGLLVIAVLFLFLGNLRAATIVAMAIPLSMLFAFSGMLRFSIAASLLSLGAIDFGMIVDSSVVMIENCVRHIAHGDSKHKDHLSVIRDAALEVRKPTMFGELIIMIVYLPILTLEGIEGKMFRPMALTVIFALVGSMVLSLTLMPVLASLMLPKKIQEREPLIMRIAHRIHAPILRIAMHHKFVVVAIGLCMLFVAFVLIAPNLGSEFVPTLSEGAVVINIVRLPGTDLTDSIRDNTNIEQEILQNFPEVSHVWSRIGTAEIATDPMGVELTDLFITLRPRPKWDKLRRDRIAKLEKEGDATKQLRQRLAARMADTQGELTDLIDKRIRDMLGPRRSFTQPIKLRMDEMGTGVRADLAVKLFGDDLKQLKETAEKIEAVLKEIHGAEDVSVEPVGGQPVLQIKLDQKALSKEGVSAATVLKLVESIGSMPLGEVVEGQYRFPLVVRLPEDVRKSRDTIARMELATAKGERIPLQRVATVEVIEDTPSTINREWGRRRIVISANVRGGRDLGSFVAEAQQAVKEKVQMPSSRYYVEWGGQFEHLITARNRLLIVVPLCIVLIFLLLYVTYGNWIDAIRVFTGVPFAAVGGIIALWLRDMPFSVSAAIGFIAMSGVAVLDDMILVSYIRQLREKGLPLDEAVTQAAITRLRPVLMTTLVAALGFLPMALSTGVGAEVQRPLATVVIGGVIGAMITSLFVVRVLYLVFKSPIASAQPTAEASAPDSDRVAETVSV